VWIVFEPLARSAGFEFVDETVGGSVPREVRTVGREGLKIQKEDGVLAHYPTVDFRATADRRQFPRRRFQRAHLRNRRQGLFPRGHSQGGPILLEPVMKVETVDPGDYLGDVIGDINRRRGAIIRSAGARPTSPSSRTCRWSEMFGYITVARNDERPRLLHHGVLALRTRAATVADDVIADGGKAKAAAVRLAPRGANRGGFCDRRHRRKRVSALGRVSLPAIFSLHLPRRRSIVPPLSLNRSSS